ncbi:MAG: hypothetical protein U0270_38260 [Labilithrix sp.]
MAIATELDGSRVSAGVLLNRLRAGIQQQACGRRRDRLAGQQTALVAGGAALYLTAPKGRKTAYLEWSTATLHW